ncbi:hypothetical protein VOLCADRAFT_99596 [Volvox carteri f. nagariensis]|uniref:Mitochondrial substrate carrier n=1 Tax=Volvox carteri f. nagariensis TaxID=3068 RepID=D8UI53_VOLCA|nr:uncharacterized protein VOLCADRAFT_99596 [Volvox carteri f. nagariensis]EFJ40615.1 hypothetical protein VOLCADRAFT_99596 [Volvox carteri f. nagariensis]|eukprot:XP_002958322.1 hypothetical protein VOLCADRAFT_99596 [Volvox carteri f. nagariensis]
MSSNKSAMAHTTVPSEGVSDPGAVAAIPQHHKQDGKRAKKPPSVVSALSGAISGSLISACVQPLDVVRTKMQADAARGVVRGTLATARVVLSEQGLRGFWAGTGPSVIRVGLGAGMHFVLLEQIRWLLSAPGVDGNLQLSNVGAAMSGGISRAIAAVLLCPVTVVKTRMEYVADVARPGAGAAAMAAGAGAGEAATASAARAAAGASASTSGAAATGAAPYGGAAVPRYRDTFHAMSTIVRTEGVRGLFRGLWPTVLTNAPYSGLYYMFYTRLKEGFSREDRPQVLVNFASGVVAAVAATLLTQPADVVRTRMQLGLGGAAATAAAATTATATATGSGLTAAARLGAWATLHEALRQQGPAALMTGAAPRILKRTTQTALVWTLYEELVPRISQLGYAAKEAWEQRAAALTKTGSGTTNTPATTTTTAAATVSTSKRQEDL